VTLRLVRDRLEGRLRSGLPGRLAILSVAAAARIQRRRLGGLRVVGITGTAGKTTAKDLTVALLAAHRAVIATRGSENYLSPVARTLLRARRRHEVGVFELGTAKPGDIAELAELVRPDVAVVTVIGDEHYEEFKSRAETAAEKGALVAALPPDGVAILNVDDPYVRPMAELTAARVVAIGRSDAAALRASEVAAAWPDRLRFVLHWDGRAVPVETRLYGEHRLPSVLAALAVALTVGVPLDDALATLARTEPTFARMTPLVVDGITFIRDEIKAPVWELDGIFAFLATARARRKVLVIGRITAFEGEAGAAYRRLAARGVAVADEIVFTGPQAWEALRGDAGDDPRVRLFETVREASAHFDATLQQGDLVVLKGRAYGDGDHMGRIALARTREVRCWRANCGRWVFCDECALLGVPAEP
jgi:UDP-N-acetylmuramyl pentapeptide synthase